MHCFVTHSLHSFDDLSLTLAICVWSVRLYAHSAARSSVPTHVSRVGIVWQECALPYGLYHVRHMQSTSRFFCVWLCFFVTRHTRTFGLPCHLRGTSRQGWIAPPYSACARCSTLTSHSIIQLSKLYQPHAIDGNSNTFAYA